MSAVPAEGEEDMLEVVGSGEDAVAERSPNFFEAATKDIVEFFESIPRRVRRVFNFCKAILGNFF